MRRSEWFKCPVDLLYDRRIGELIISEGAKGYGTYFYILNQLYRQEDGRLFFWHLRALRKKGFSAAYMEKIVRYYGLFIIKGEYFESAINYRCSASGTAPGKVEKTMKNAPEMVGNLSADEREMSGRPTNEEETPEKNGIGEKGCNSLSDNEKCRKPECPYARVRIKMIEDKIKNIIRKRKRVSADDDVAEQTFDSQPASSSPCSRSGADGAAQRGGCRTSAGQMPHSAGADATLRRRKCHTSAAARCHIGSAGLCLTYPRTG